MQKRVIKTKLVGKEELFRVIALSEATGLPILLVGEPGVAKSQTLIDYASAMYNYDKQKAKENLFILQLGDSTRGSDIAGKVDMKELLINKQYKICAPISKKEYILIDEVDKGSSGVRNNMLSLMREKALMHGDEIIRCNWKLFAGSCNEITADASDKPFWDRFVIKHKVERIVSKDLSSIWDEKEITLEFNIPEKQDLKDEPLNLRKMDAFVKHIYAGLSDRTASYLPKVTKAIKIIWQVSENEAIMKCCELVCPSFMVGLDKVLEDPKTIALKSKIAGINGINDVDYMSLTLSDIEKEIATYDPKSEADTIKELRKLLKKTVSASPVCKQILEQAKLQQQSLNKLAIEIDN